MCRCAHTIVRLRLADEGLNHKLVLKVTDLVAVQGLALLDTKDGVSALQLVGVLILAEAVDKVAQLVHMLQTLSYHHLLMNQVGLGQVGPSLDIDQQV